MCLSISDSAKPLSQDTNSGILSPVGCYGAIQSRMTKDFEIILNGSTPAFSRFSPVLFLYPGYAEGDSHFSCCIRGGCRLWLCTRNYLSHSLLPSWCFSSSDSCLVMKEGQVSPVAGDNVSQGQLRRSFLSSLFEGAENPLLQGKNDSCLKTQPLDERVQSYSSLSPFLQDGA